MAFNPLWRRKWLIAIVLLAVVLLIWASGISSWPDQRRGMRDVSEQDEVYRYLAQQLAEPSLCEKIPWSSKSPGGFFLEPSYERSECYDFIAGRTRNPWLCWKVRRLGAVSFLSEQTSVASCMRHAWRGMNAGTGVAPATLVSFFGKLGYDPDTIPDEGITPPLTKLRDVYWQLSKRLDLVARIEKAAGASGPLSDQNGDATNAAYLADMTAIVTKDSRWCNRIPADLPLAGQPAGFRNWCKFAIASNTKNAALCREIPIPPSERDPRLSLQATCLFQVGSPYSKGTYGPEVPEDSRIKAIMSELGYELPAAKDLPVWEIYTAYDNFLDELNKQSDAQHVAARKRFIERVRQFH